MRGLGAEKRMYSSKIELNAHFCTFRSEPTRQPVRCYRFTSNTTSVSITP